MPVCKVMFLNTLALKEWMVHNWVKNDYEDEIVNEHIEEPTEDDVDEHEYIENIGKDKGEKHVSKKKKIIAEWFEKLPFNLILSPCGKQKNSCMIRTRNIVATNKNYGGP